jgi:hypothetical protein
MANAQKQTFILINDKVRQNALAAFYNADDGAVVTIGPKNRSLDQNAKLHAMLTDVAKSGIEWAGKPRSVDEWKVIIISGHSVATGHGGEVIPGIEGEFVAIRESSASMSVSRAASLIEYLLAFCATNGIELTETRRRGFMDDRYGREAA